MQKDILAIFNLQGLGRKLDGLEVREGEVVFYFQESRRACGKPFTEVSPFIRPRQRRTKAAERAILESLRARSFKSVQEREGISYGVSSRVLRRCLDPQKVTWPEGTIALSIDGHSFRGTRMVNTITDVQARCPLTILPDSRKESLQRFLRDIPPEVKCRIREVCIDMDTLLLAAVEQELSEVPVVGDHFHLIQDANRRMDEARKIEQDACRREIPKWKSPNFPMTPRWSNGDGRSREGAPTSSTSLTIGQLTLTRRVSILKSR
jgi:transposase